MDPYECNVVFLNEKYGEFQYTIEGYADLPEPIKRVDNKECCIEENYEFTIDLELQNRLLQSAFTLLKSEKIPQTTKKPTRTTQMYMDTSGQERSQFSVECNRPQFFSLNSIAIYTGDIMIPNRTLSSVGKELNKDPSRRNSVKEKDLNRSESHLSENVAIESQLVGNRIEILKIPVKFFAKVCQVYDCDIILRNLDNPLDIRLIKVQVLVKPRNIFGKMEFNCPVLCDITQEIPIYNSSEVDWNVKFELNDNCKYYS